MKFGFIDSLKRIFIFNYRLSDSRSLGEVRVRLEKSRFEVVDPSIFMIPIDYMRKCLTDACGVTLPESVNYNDSLAVKSSTVHPTMIYFLFLQRDDVSGLLLIFETEHSWYSYEKILESIRAFERNAGIKSKYIGLFIPSRKVFLWGP